MNLYMAGNGDMWIVWETNYEDSGASDTFDFDGEAAEPGTQIFLVLEINYYDSTGELQRGYLCSEIIVIP